MEVTDTFKYLGITLDNKLTFGPHVQGVYKKCQQRLYLLRKLRSFHINPKLLLLLYRSIIESVLTYCSICFFSCYVCLLQRYASPHLQNCFQDHRPSEKQPVRKVRKARRSEKHMQLCTDPARPPTHPPTH